MLKGYGDGSFGGGTGPSVQCLDKRKRARNDFILTKIMQSSSSYVNAENECSPPRKKKQKKRKGTNKEKEIHVNKWQLSDSDSTINDSEDTRQPGNKRVKRSSAFLVDLKNAISSTMNLIDLGQVTNTSRWFELSISSSRGRTYRVEIKEAVNCTCEFFNQKNTPCKHILYVFLNVLNVCESSHLLQQVYLTKNELLNIFHHKVPISNENIKLTNRAILQSTSTLTRIVLPPQENVPLSPSLPAKPFMPEPQNDPYWLLKRTGNISKCHGYKSHLDNYVLSCIEFVFWFSENSPKYYHPNFLCLKKRRPNVKVTREIIKCHEDAVITEETEACLF